MKQYIPTLTNHRAKKTSTALFAVSMLLFALSGLKMLPYRWILQLVSFTLLTAAIMVCVRFLFRSYCYRIEPCEDGCEFTVLELSKSGAHTVCRLSLSALLSIEPYTKERLADKKGIKIFNYCVDIAPKDAYLLSFSDSTYSPSPSPICLKIQSDEDFREALEGFMRTNS